MKKMAREQESVNEDRYDTAEGGMEDHMAGKYQDMGMGTIKGAVKSGPMSTNRGHNPAVPCISKHPVKSLAKSGRGSKGQE